MSKKRADDNYLKELNWEQMPQLMLFIRCQDKLETILINLKYEIERLKLLYGEKSILSIINEQDENGNSLIMYLCGIRELNNSTYKLVKSLLKKNPNLNLKNKNGNTILHIMIDRNKINSMTNIENKNEKKILDLLKKNNINLFIKDSYYNLIPLEYTVYKYKEIKNYYFKNLGNTYSDFVDSEYLKNYYDLLTEKYHQKKQLNEKKLLISKLPICEDLMLNIVNMI